MAAAAADVEPPHLSRNLRRTFLLSATATAAADCCCLLLAAAGCCCCLLTSGRQKPATFARTAPSVLKTAHLPYGDQIAEANGEFLAPKISS